MACILVGVLFNRGGLTPIPLRQNQCEILFTTSASPVGITPALPRKNSPYTQQKAHRRNPAASAVCEVRYLPSWLAHEGLHHLAEVIGEAEVAAVVAVGQLLVVEAEERELRGVQIVDVHFVLHGL